MGKVTNMSPPHPFLSQKGWRMCTRTDKLPPFTPERLLPTLEASLCIHCTVLLQEDIGQEGLQKSCFTKMKAFTFFPSQQTSETLGYAGELLPALLTLWQ